MMEPIKESRNVEFDVIYADGTRRHVPEGILFEVEDNRMNVHIGTKRTAVLFATAEALIETIKSMGLTEAFRAYIEDAPGNEGGEENGI